jgi:hypothetical protein
LDDGGQLAGYGGTWNLPRQLPNVNDAIGVAVSDPGFEEFPDATRVRPPIPCWTAVLRQGGKAVTVWGNMFPLVSTYYVSHRQPVTFPAPSGVTFRSIHGGTGPVYAVDTAGGVWIATASASWQRISDAPKSIAVYPRSYGLFGLTEGGAVWFKGRYFALSVHRYVGDPTRPVYFQIG